MTLQWKRTADGLPEEPKDPEQGYVVMETEDQISYPSTVSWDHLHTYPGQYALYCKLPEILPPERSSKLIRFLEQEQLADNGAAGYMLREALFEELIAKAKRGDFDE